MLTVGTITSKINVTPKGCLFGHFEATLDYRQAILLAHNNISQICYCSQILLQSAPVNCSYSDIFGCNIYFAGGGTSYFKFK